MTRAAIAQRGAARGFTLVELMIAITLALLLTVALIAAMVSVSSTNRVQNGAARLLENARFALATIARDVRHAGNQLCMNYAGVDGALAPGGALHVDSTKPVSVRFDATAAPWHLGRSPHAAAYAVDPAELVRGVECGAACGTTSALEHFPALANAPLPALGSNAGNRARGADVLSLRYLNGAGRPVVSIAGAARGDGLPVRIRLAPGGTSPASGAALIGDCGGMYAARVSVSGDEVTLTGNFDDDVAPGIVPAQARVFDLVRDFAPVTYYLRVVEIEGAQGAPRRVSALVRRSGGSDETVALGIERFDVLYHVETSSGTTRVIDAEQVGAMSAAECRNVLPNDALAATPGCGWRSLKGLEIHLLANSVDDVDGDTVDPVLYAWKFDGTRNLAGVYEQPTALPSGLPVGRMLRRQFRTYVALRGFNH